MNYYIDYLSKDHNHRPERIYFETYKEAREWGRANLDNFHPDMIRMNH